MGRGASLDGRPDAGFLVFLVEVPGLKRQACLSSRSLRTAGLVAAEWERDKHKSKQFAMRVSKELRG